VIDKDRLLKPRLAESDYDIPDVGTVRIRRLAWDECAEITAWTEKGRDSKAVYRRVLALALVDPVLSEDEVAEWMRGAPAGEIEDLARHVLTASGMQEGAQKSL
jgi:hypothetical protein